MLRAAIYARYSTHQQRETSIEDQVRRCTEVAQRFGYETTEALVFADAAISGKDEAVDKRAGYQDLLQAWDERRFDAIVVDELSRLTRGGVEFARLHDRIEKSRVRLITGDGIDSTQPSWSLVYNIHAAVAQQARREVRYRVVRGMHGQLKRGFMIADAAFGYRAVVEFKEDGEPLGTRWEIDEREAALVREIYRRRRDGASYMSIARWLNACDVPPPRKARDGSPGYWRQSSVHRLVRNPIYVGRFVWNGSTFAQAKARKEGREIQPEAFERPHLRIVDDETYRIVTSTSAKPHRGGRRRLFAGLLSCGQCGSTLTVKASPGGVESAYCASCVTKSAATERSNHPGYISAEAVKQALLFALKTTFGAEARDAFRQRLQRRLEGDTTAEAERLQRALSQVQSACDRLAVLIADMPAASRDLERQLRRKAEERSRLEMELEAARRTTLGAKDRAAIERQLEVDPMTLLAELLSGGAEVERLQAVIGRLCPRITLIGKPGRYVSLVEFEMVPGQAYAECSETTPITGEKVTLRIEVRCTAERPVRWQARRVG